MTVFPAGSRLPRLRHRANWKGPISGSPIAIRPQRGWCARHLIFLEKLSAQGRS